jgi:AAA15 family ATPase/GTPase
MLLNVRITNYRSINERIELSLIPSDLKNPENRIKKTNPDATKNKDYYGLTSAALYGPNASGKSNIVRALADFVLFVEKSTEAKPNEKISLNQPFKLNANSLKSPSCFAIDFVLENVLYTYSIEILHHIILKESLLFFPKGIQVKIFERKEQVFVKGNGYEGIFETIKQRTTENQLFLSKAALENVEIIKKVYQYITSIFILTTDTFHSNEFNKQFSRMLFKNSEQWDSQLKLSKSLLRNIDTQVVDFKEIEGNIKTFHLNDKNEKIEFEFEDESSGTQRIIAFVPFILSKLKEGGVLVVDEFERSLHPEIAQYILALFNDLEVNTKAAQFIFATHDTTLLSPENKLRRDQINLVEKNSNGETEMFAVSDIKGIREGNYEKWYLEGRLGALPTIARETFRHELIDFINL